MAQQKVDDAGKPRYMEIELRDKRFRIYEKPKQTYYFQLGRRGRLSKKDFEKYAAWKAVVAIKINYTKLGGNGRHPVFIEMVAFKIHFEKSNVQAWLDAMTNPDTTFLRNWISRLKTDNEKLNDFIDLLLNSPDSEIETDVKSGDFILGTKKIVPTDEPEEEGIEGAKYSYSRKRG